MQANTQQRRDCARVLSRTRLILMQPDDDDDGVCSSVRVEVDDVDLLSLCSLAVLARQC